MIHFNKMYLLLRKRRVLNILYHSEPGIVEAGYRSLTKGALEQQWNDSKRGCSLAANRVEPRVNSRPYAISSWHRDESFYIFIG